MEREVRCAILSVAISLIPVSLALPCSVEHVRTAEQITDAAEAIVLAEAAKYIKKSEYDGIVQFRVVEVLKGTWSSTGLELGGQTDYYDGPNEKIPPYRFVRRGGRHGNCFANDYKLGAMFLLFLRGGSATWAPLAATNEEVAGPNDPWVWWVKGYLAGVGDTAEAQPQPSK